MNLNLTHLHHATTSAYTVGIGNLTLFFSYSTCIGFNYCDPTTGEQITGRREEQFSVTTAKHYGALGCRHYPTMTEQEFHDAVHNCIVDMSISHVMRSADPAAANAQFNLTYGV